MSAAHKRLWTPARRAAHGEKMRQAHKDSPESYKWTAPRRAKMSAALAARKEKDPEAYLAQVREAGRRGGKYKRKVEGLHALADKNHEAWRGELSPAQVRYLERVRSREGRAAVSERSLRVSRKGEPKPRWTAGEVDCLLRHCEWRDGLPYILAARVSAAAAATGRGEKAVKWQTRQIRNKVRAGGWTGIPT